MGYAIYHTAKGKGSGGGLQNHIDRTEGKEHTYRNANPETTKYNVDLTNEKYKNLKLSEAVNLRISEGYKSPRKIRQDSVKYLTHVLTGTHEDMIKIWDESKHNQWIKANAEFMKEEFGDKNIIKAVLHLDEKTPHLHVVTVPLTKDGRLSAKEIMGGSKEMKQRQDRYAEKMKQFGLERGITGTKRKHQTAKEYDREVSIAKKRASEMKITPIRGTFGIKKDETIDKYKKELKTAYLGLEASKLEVKKLKENSKAFDPIRKERISLNSQNINLRWERKDLGKKHKQNIQKIISNPQLLKKAQEEIKKDERNQGRSI